MSRFKLRDTCEVSINREDGTPIIIFEDLPVNDVKSNHEGVSIKLNVDEDIINEIIETIKTS